MLQIQIHLLRAKWEPTKFRITLTANF
uniref:Uncharacterized protein n=1 Tax=Anguilla anguilla TaxID=7936 RepID=A0A0E9QML9_ANGAN